MRNFDEEARKERLDADRSFVIGGETFYYRAAVAPEVVLDWNDIVTGKVDSSDTRVWVEMYDQTTLAMLAPGQEEKWKKVRSADVEHPLNISDVREVFYFLLEQATGRPTGEPQGSSDGSSQNGTASKDESSQPAEALTA